MSKKDDINARHVGELADFAKWVSKYVCSDDFEDDAGWFAEVACRKLVKLGILKINEDRYERID